jgi:hypothetical protein
MDDFEFQNTEENNNQDSQPQFPSENTNMENFIPMKEQEDNIDFNQNINPESNNMNMMNMMMNTNVLDEEEQKRIEEREKEQIERRKKIEEKIQFELKKKEELRQKAIEFLNDFSNKRLEEIEKRKNENIKKEKELLENKKLLKEGKLNPWESITENIAMKDSEYKGNKDVKRMREVIINRKNDVKEEGDKI